MIVLEKTDINDNMINSKKFQGKATFYKQRVKVPFTIYDKHHIYVPDDWEPLKLNEPRRWKSEEITPSSSQTASLQSHHWTVSRHAKQGFW